MPQRNNQRRLVDAPSSSRRTTNTLSTEEGLQSMHAGGAHTAADHSTPPRRFWPCIQYSLTLRNLPNVGTKRSSNVGRNTDDGEQTADNEAQAAGDATPAAKRQRTGPKSSSLAPPPDLGASETASLTLPAASTTEQAPPLPSTAIEQATSPVPWREMSPRAALATPPPPASSTTPIRSTVDGLQALLAKFMTHGKPVPNSDIASITLATAAPSQITEGLLLYCTSMECSPWPVPVRTIRALLPELETWPKRAGQAEYTPSTTDVFCALFTVEGYEDDFSIPRAMIWQPGPAPGGQRGTYHGVIVFQQFVEHIFATLRDTCKSLSDQLDNIKRQLATDIAEQEISEQQKLIAHVLDCAAESGPFEPLQPLDLSPLAGLDAFRSLQRAVGLLRVTQVASAVYLRLLVDERPTREE